MTDPDMLDASICDAVVIGHCVMIVGDQIVYAGPIKGAPSTGGKTVLLNAADFKKLEVLVNKRRH